jgi:hypothetical protein
VYFEGVYVFLKQGWYKKEIICFYNTSIEWGCRRKNKIVQEMARTMLMDSKLKDFFWTHAMHTIVHIQKKIMIMNKSDKTPYKLWKGRSKNVKHLRVFGIKCYIKKKDPTMGRFDSHVEKGVVVGY